MLLNVPHRLTDADLIAAIGSLAAVERKATAALIAHLTELEARNLHLAQGFRSIFGYCRHVLHCSEQEAYNRMQAVHAARRFPVILALLSEGRLHLTAVRLLAPHLSDEDHLALLGGAIHKSRREIVALLARWFPSPDVASSIRKLPAAPALVPQTDPRVSATDAAPLPKAAGHAPDPAEPEAAASDAGAATPVPRTAAAAHRSVVAPLSAERYRLQVTLPQSAHDDLRCLQDLMRREIPDGDAAAIVARALELLRRSAERRAFAATTKPRPPGASTPGSRDIPAHVQRAVWQRDEGQCAFEGLTARCSERSFLEFHHVQPWAVGGPPSAENIALRCRAHNSYEASRYFGPIREAMAVRGDFSFRNESRGGRRDPTGPAP